MYIIHCKGACVNQPKLSPNIKWLPIEPQADLPLLDLTQHVVLDFNPKNGLK